MRLGRPPRRATAECFDSTRRLICVPDRSARDATREFGASSPGCLTLSESAFCAYGRGENGISN